MMQRALFGIWLCSAMAELICPDETWTVATSSSCYKHQGLMAMGSCIRNCSAVGASLPCVRDDAENEFLHDYMLRFNLWPVYLGLYQEDVIYSNEGWHNWASGCQSSYRQWDERSFNNEREPRDAPDSQAHCTAADGGSWHSFPCDEDFRDSPSSCVCEWPANTSDIFFEKTYLFQDTTRPRRCLAELRSCCSKCKADAADLVHCRWTCSRLLDSSGVPRKSDLSMIALPCCVAPILAIIVGFSTRALAFPRPHRFIAGLTSGVGVIVLGLLPFATMAPQLCGQVSFQNNYDGIATIYPLALLMEAGSIGGLSISFAWLFFRCFGSLGKLAVLYFVLACVLNLSGVIGVLSVTCNGSLHVGMPFYAAWLSGSFVTNLVLQRIVLTCGLLVRAGMLQTAMRYTFNIEVATALILLASLVVSSLGAPGRIRMAFADFAGYCVALTTLLFMLLDALFSFTSSAAMVLGLRKIQGIKTQSTTSSAQVATGPFSRDELDRVIFFARADLVLVVLSMATTSLFYVSLLNFLLIAARGRSELEGGDHSGALSLVYLSMLLDSIFNDACVVFVGFGPIESALRAVGAMASEEATANSSLHDAAPDVVGASL